MVKLGFVGLSYRKTTKLSEIVQNIQSLVPSVQTGFTQILLSITMLTKTGSQMIVNNLKQLGHGLSNTETVFKQDKRAEWTKRLKSIIPSNIKNGVIATHVFDNIHWKNKTLDRIKTHHMKSNVSVDADFNFELKIYIYIYLCIYTYTFAYTYLHVYTHIGIRLDDTKTASYCFFMNSKAKKLAKIH